MVFPVRGVLTLYQERGTKGLGSLPNIGVKLAQEAAAWLQEQSAG